MCADLIASRKNGSAGNGFILGSGFEPNANLTFSHRFNYWAFYNCHWRLFMVHSWYVFSNVRSCTIPGYAGQLTPKYRN